MRLFLLSICIVGMVLCINAQELSFQNVQFRQAVFYTRDSSKFTGRLQENFPDGKTRSVCQVKNGELAGTAKVFYPNGQLHFIFQYSAGKLCCVFSEYFENGELKLQGEIGAQHLSGGNVIHKLFYAYYDAKGKYISKVKPKARIQFFNSEMLSGFFNHELSPNDIAGYRIFDNALQDFGMFIKDSRSISAPLRP